VNWNTHPLSSLSFPHSLPSARHRPSSFSPHISRTSYDHFHLWFIFTSLATAIHVLSSHQYTQTLRYCTYPPRLTPPFLTTSDHLQLPCMAAPTQQLPPWLSYSSSILTDNAGDPTSTYTTVINLPLTYYGPPVSLWNFRRHFRFQEIGPIFLPSSKGVLALILRPHDIVNVYTLSLPVIWVGRLRTSSVSDPPRY